MPQKKKTFDIQEFKNYINEQLAIPNNSNVDEKVREGLCRAWEKVSCSTGNYKGYNYLYWLQGGCKAWEDAKVPDHESNNPEAHREYWELKDCFMHGNLGRYARIYY